MGMEYGGKSRCSTELFVVLGKRLQDILDTGKQQGIDCFLVFPGKIPELFWEGKGDQVVLGRQPLAQLILDPLPVFMILAVGTSSGGRRNGEHRPSFRSCDRYIVPVYAAHALACIAP